VPAYYVSTRRNNNYAQYTEDNTISHRREELHDHRQNRTSAGLPPSEELDNHRHNLTSVGLSSINDVFFDSNMCHELRRPSASEIRYRHTYWQVQQDGHEDIVVYSAFYDDRPIVGVLPWIRILGVRRLSDTHVWCYVWYFQKETPFVTQAEVIATGADQSVKNGEVYSQNLFSCQLNRSNFIPTHVSIATTLCANSTISLEITRPAKSDKWIHNFGVCLEVNFGYFPPELIVEWMEAYSIFGITHVNIYNGSIDSRLDRVFDYYRQKGILEIRQMPPAVEDYTIDGVRLGSPASLNDCMMRNMYSHRFIVIVDFDEIIVPRINSNYLDMLLYIDRSQNRPQSHHTYSFRNAYFFKYFPEDEVQPKALKTLRLRYRAQISDYLFGTKSFVDPRQCLSVFNHYCWIPFPDSDSPGVDVETSIALSHHYREICPFDKDQCDGYANVKVRDDIMLKYKDKLQDRVSELLKYFTISRV